MVCPPDAHHIPRDSTCDIILLAPDQPANVTISTAESYEEFLVAQETRYIFVAVLA